MNNHTKTALITGSGQNIGRGIAHHLAAAGFNIIVNGSSDREAAENVASEVRYRGAAAMVAMGDVGDKVAAHKIVKAGLEHFGTIDVLINNAAIRPHAPFLEINDDDWQRVIDVDLNAAVWISRMVLPQMIKKGWGRIISFSGMNAQRGYPGASSVAVAKHAVWGLTKSLAAEFGPNGITANIISPGTFPTENPAKTKDPKFAKLLNENPTRRLGKSDDIGAMVVYLCSKNGGFVNGQMLQINGGVVTQF
jgi:3-oxoacyl-[acyl-carrier protein] reductase